MNLEDNDDEKMIMRHDADDIASLLPMLSSFRFNGVDGKMPRFVK